MLKVSETKLPKETFAGDVNLNLLAQANYVYEDRSHVGLRNTKTRSEVNRTTKKVYKQKGTGGARHGSRRANVFVGGGIVFGPRAIRRILSLPFGAKQAAKVAAFSAKAKEKKVVVVSGVDKIAKTKEVAEFVKKLEGKRFTFLVSEKAKGTFRFFRNLANVQAMPYKDVNAFDILNGGVMLIDENVFEKAVAVKEAKKETVKADKKVTK